jgi:hypothetical protein
MRNRTRIDENLLGKISERTGKSKKYIREQISKRASRLSVTSEAAQILWAKELGIGTTTALRKLLPYMREQIHRSMPTLFADHAAFRGKTGKIPSKNRKRIDPISLAVEYLLSDEELKSRCSDLLRKHRHQDRVFREATTILENRIKRLANIHRRLNPEPLVNTALNPDPARAILLVSTDQGEQMGFHSICKGIVLTFRHRAHHELDDKVTREDALKFCAFIDVILAILGKAQVRQIL